MNRQQAVLRGVGAKDDGAGPVSEENVGGAVRPVDDPGEQFGADEQGFACRAPRLTYWSATERP